MNVITLSWVSAWPDLQPPHNEPPTHTHTQCCAPDTSAPECLGTSLLNTVAHAQDFLLDSSRERCALWGWSCSALAWRVQRRFTDRDNSLTAACLHRRGIGRQSSLSFQWDLSFIAPRRWPSRARSCLGYCIAPSLAISWSSNHLLKFVHSSLFSWDSHFCWFFIFFLLNCPSITCWTYFWLANKLVFLTAILPFE